MSSHTSPISPREAALLELIGEHVCTLVWGDTGSPEYAFSCALLAEFGRAGVLWHNFPSRRDLEDCMRGIVPGPNAGVQREHAFSLLCHLEFSDGELAAFLHSVMGEMNSSSLLAGAVTHPHAGELTWRAVVAVSPLGRATLASEGDARCYRSAVARRHILEEADYYPHCLPNLAATAGSAAEADALLRRYLKIRPDCWQNLFRCLSTAQVSALGPEVLADLLAAMPADAKEWLINLMPRIRAGEVVESDLAAALRLPPW